MFKIQKSKNDELGLFASEYIPAKTIIHSLEGELYQERTRESIEVDVSVNGERKTMHILDELFQYCNHSFTPNIKISRDTHYVSSIGHIEEGEEITFDYTEHETAIVSPFRDKDSGKNVEK